ncbi:MAG: imidazole glycerol phosphate synthase subunit HisH [Canidatus Methanoxibalbensis ujae]|nr:imidazole glycerol phosphate synthase subunit HisH [Candidatus Methanoxibalbensis ujae]MCW7077723.1 imidazole glycerol phosphate synthase subunit HisH [Candidatus Methanoxibalbensis ujae]
MIAIMNYGMGNLFSIYNSMKKVNGEPELVSVGEINMLRQADGIIIPGVGAYDDGMRRLKPIADELREILSGGVPLLGICIGMQLLFEESEEGNERGLSLIPGRVVRLPETVRVPHMGWNNLHFSYSEILSEILEGISEHDYFYFVHSYYCAPRDERHIVAFSEYGVRFAAVVNIDNIYGVQFHPEKSSKKGLHILKNFVHICKR